LLSRIYGVRMDEELARQLEQAAKADDRPVSSLIRKFTRDGLKTLTAGASSAKEVNIEGGE